VANAAEKAGLPSVAAITLPNQIGWIFNSIAADGNRIGSAFAGSSPTTRDISVVTGSINAVPTLCDIGLSAAETVYTVSRIATGMKVVNQGGSDALLASDAQRMLTQHKADLIRSMPGTLRDVVLGSVSLPARVFGDVHPGESLFGGLTAAYHATSSVTMSSGALFVAAGALSARAIDRSVDRNLALSGALRNPPSRRTDTFGSEASALDDKLANDPDALISPNVHSILRTHDDDYIAAFMTRFESLDPDRRKQLKRLLHFPGEQIKLNALNLGRCTNLNTASHRREVREKVIDAFVAYDLQGDSAESLFSHFEKIKKEARGAGSAPRRAAVLKFLKDHQIDQAEFGWNTLNALSTSGVEKDFLARYDRLDKEQRARLRSAMHFDSWRFWKPSGTLTTTKARRADIRQAMIKRFAAGNSIEDIELFKWKSNAHFNAAQEKSERRWSTSPSGLLRQNMDAVLQSHLDALKEEQRHAKVQMTYGAINMAASVAELAVNPLALAPKMTATHAVLAPLYLVYSARRGLAKQIRERNVNSIDAYMREESLLVTLPRAILDLTTPESPALKHLSDDPAFLKNELQLSDAEIKKLLELKKSGNTIAMHEMLIAKAPENSLLLALRLISESLCNANIEVSGVKKSALALLEQERAGGTETALKRIHPAGNPDDTYNALKEHFLDNGAYKTSMRIDRVDDSARDTDSDDTAYLDSATAELSIEAQTRLARENPYFALRLFVEALFSDGPSAAHARNTLRDFRFTETEIADLHAQGKKEASNWLAEHLFGDNVRQRFAPITLDQPGRDRAAKMVDQVRLRAGSVTSTEPLTWRRNFEDHGLQIIENQGTPGLDSMLFALYHSFSGKDHSRSSDLNKKISRARIAVLKEINAADVDIEKHWDQIVAVAGQSFGKEKPKVKLVQTNGHPSVLGGPGKEDAVLCYDNRTQRMFVVHGSARPPRQATAAQPPKPARFSMSKRTSVFATRFSLPMIDTSDPGFHEVFSFLDMDHS
jgi:hypothetical protein